MYNLGPSFRKLFPKIGFEVVLLPVIDIFHENLMAFTKTDITLSEACRKYTFQNMLQNAIRTPCEVGEGSFAQEIMLC